MSRPAIAAIGAALIAGLCAVAYLVAASSLESSVRDDLRVRVANAQDLLVRDAELEGLELMQGAARLALDSRLAAALAAEPADPAPAEQAFAEHRRELDDRRRPDILALTDAAGRLLALTTGEQRVANPIAGTYLDGGEIKYPALAMALASKLRSASVWPYENQGPMKVAVAPVIDEAGAVAGALLIARHITSERATRDSRQLGVEVAYFYGGEVHAKSFEGELPAAMFAEGGVAVSALASDQGIAEIVSIQLGGSGEHIATAGRLPLFSSLGERPAELGPPRAGAVVAASVDGALASLASLKLAIGLVGLGAVVVMLLAILLTARRILGPIDELEAGVAEMLDGNLDATFEPSSADLDGLANGLNVLMSRLLGRPEPGAEEYDADGELIGSESSMRFSPQELPGDNAPALALAREPEADYYTRLFAEYTAALKAAGGSVVGLTLEAFINKLRLSEVTLCEKYQASEVRFVVATEGGEVILKPVPFG